MAARLRARHQDEIRAKIQASQLVNRLTSHALGKLKKNPMTPCQVQAALGLLKKVVGDVQTVQGSGDNGEHVFELKAPWLKEFVQHRGMD